MLLVSDNDDVDDDGDDDDDVVEEDGYGVELVDGVQLVRRLTWECPIVRTKGSSLFCC